MKNVCLPEISFREAGSSHSIGETSCHYNAKPPVSNAVPFQDAGPMERRRVGDRMKTICFKKVDGVELLADVYLPDASEVTDRKRPIGEP